MVAILPTLPPLNYENLNKRIGKLKEYPLKIPVAIIAIVLVVSTLFMVVTLVIIALVICKLRGNLKALLPIGKIMIGKANSGEINQVRQALRTLLDLTLDINYHQSYQKRGNHYSRHQKLPEHLKSQFCLLQQISRGMKST